MSLGIEVSTLRIVRLAGVAFPLFGCGDGTDPSAPAEIAISPSIVILDSVGDTVQFRARVQDETGATIVGTAVQWSSSNPLVAAIDVGTGFATTHAIGSSTINAEAGAASGTATLEVYVPPDSVYLVGETYLGRSQYTEYLAGDLPIILSAPHGGYLEPDEIPDRAFGTTAQDRQTQELARTFAVAIYDRTGRHPHIVICRLRRNKLDANREIVEAAQGNAFAEWAWSEYHGFIEAAKQAVADQFGRGFYIDLHGHGHEIQRLELGYLLSSSDLGLPDNLLDSPDIVNQSSIRTLATEADAGFVELVRGPTSFGGLIGQLSFPAVPSPTYPDPGGAPYFTGGYDTRRHGSRNGGPVSGLQLEANWTGVRDNASNRALFASALSSVMEIYLLTHFKVDIRAGPAHTIHAAALDSAQP